jgi:hypothetical protein
VGFSVLGIVVFVCGLLPGETLQSGRIADGGELHSWLQQLYVCVWPGRYKQERELRFLIIPLVSTSNW